MTRARRHFRPSRHASRGRRARWLEAHVIALSTFVEQFVCADCGSRRSDFACTCMTCLGPSDDEDGCAVYHEDVDDCPDATCKSVDACGYCGSCDHEVGAEWIPFKPEKQR